MAEDNNNRDANGNLRVSQMILTLDRGNFTVSIGGQTENHDEALAILDLARRQIERKMRAAEVQQMMGARLPITLPRGPVRQ